jgi:outer membrane biosynthesis protein TonB
MRFLKLKLVTLPALMLCMGVFCLPAYAANAAPPAAVAWINGDGLYIEVRGGQSGVEAVYINDARVNYRVDGKLELPAASYAGTGQYINIYAADFAGNKSNEVLLLNPFYIPPPVTPAPTAKPPEPPPVRETSAPTPVIAQEPTPTPVPVITYEPTPAPVVAPEPTAVPEPVVTPEPISAPESENPFTPGGAGTALDNATEGDGKEFLTFTAEDGSVFYLIVDRQRDSENVYLLNPVNEQDLMALAEKNGKAVNGGTSAIPTPEPEPVSEPEPAPEPEPEPAAVPAKNNSSMYILVLVVVIVVGGAGYYFKIVRGRKDAADDGDEDEYEDEYGYDDETEEDDIDDPETDSEEEQE